MARIPPSTGKTQKLESGLIPTTASAWRQATEQGALVTLPGSGNIARLRKPSLTALAGTSNGVPNPLSSEVLRLMAAPPPKTDEERLTNVKRNSRAMVEVARLCLVEPKLKIDGEPGEGEIGPGDLANMDYSFIYYIWVEGSAADAEPFRVDRGAGAG